MRVVRTRFGALALLAVALLVGGCGGQRGSVSAVPAVDVPTVRSVSPALIPAPPMARTTLLPPSAMTSIRPQIAIQPLGWTQIPGGASFVAAGPDGSIWVLSNQGAGPDQAIWHYANGAWSNISGGATRLAVAPDNTLWAVTAAGGIFHYTGSWTQIAGGASDISVGPDGSVYVISNQGGGPFGRGAWHYANGAWTQLPGGGIRVAASWDLGTHLGTITPGTLWVLNTPGDLWYYNAANGFHQLGGGGVEMAPTSNGGMFVLGFPASPNGYPLWYNDLNTGTWTQMTGGGVSVATDSRHVYAIGSAGGIYAAPVTAVSNATPTPMPTPTVQPGNGTPLAGPNLSPTNGWGPTAVANAFNFPVQSGFDGTGLTVAIVIDSAFDGNDLAAYLSYFQTPHTSRRIASTMVDGGAGIGPDQGEASLDNETIAGLAPGANVTTYVIPDLSYASIVDGYNQIITDHTAAIVNSSFGGCESPGSVGQYSMNTVIAQGVSNGIAFVASSGDSGNECDVFEVGASYPASDPNVIGVGGTETYRPAGFTLTSTTAWNDSAVGSPAGTGGGVSASFGLPAYQVGLPGVASTKMRNVPDIAMPAEYDAIYQQGWFHVYGTSWGAPAFAAMLAEVYQYCNAQSLNPAALPYLAYQRAGYGAFLDVVSGNNQMNGLSPSYAAHSGYDNATGIGVPLGVPIALALCPNRVPSSHMRESASSRALAVRGPSTPVAADVVPKVRDLVYQGPRPQNQTTRIQIVLRPTATISADERTVVAALEAAGFRITRTFGNHLVVDAEASAAAVERLFQTHIVNLAQARHGTRYAPNQAAVIPASLAPYVAGLTLDNVVTMHTRY